MTMIARAPRGYDSPRRRQQVAETRERIVSAGCEILSRSSIRDWRGLTIRAVADQAGVNERTVYRYFVNERGLRDAVMQRLEHEAGIHLDGMRLEDVAEVTAKILRHIASYPRQTKPPLDPTLSEAGGRQRAALCDALREATPDLNAQDREAVAAVLDVLWSVAGYERLVVDWKFDHLRAISALTWVVGLVEDAVLAGGSPQPVSAAADARFARANPRRDTLASK